MISIYVSLTSLGTQRTIEQPKCLDYSLVYRAPSDISLSKETENVVKWTGINNLFS